MTVEDTTTVIGEPVTVEESSENVLVLVIV